MHYGGYEVESAYPMTPHSCMSLIIIDWMVFCLVMIVLSRIQRFLYFGQIKDPVLRLGKRQET